MSVRRLLLQACVVIFKGVTPHFSLNIYDYNDSFCMLKAKHILFLAKKIGTTEFIDIIFVYQLRPCGMPKMC